MATRTSPVFRGKYILTTFLNTPPPPPLPERADARGEQQGAATRRRRCGSSWSGIASNPTCASCHRIIDPPGFALENFNSVGQWRDTGADGAPIDTGGVLADGTKVDGPVALRNAILSRPEAFATMLTERMLTYALGRGVEPSDMPVVRSIVKKAAPNDYRLASIFRASSKARRSRCGPGWSRPKPRIESHSVRTERRQRP